MPYSKKRMVTDGLSPSEGLEKKKKDLCLKNNPGGLFGVTEPIVKCKENRICPSLIFTHEISCDDVQVAQFQC